MNRLLLRAGAILRKGWPWLVAQSVFLGLSLLKLFPANASINMMERLARLIGPKLRRHKLMLYNLKRAFPERTDAERQEIALDAWGSLGCMAAEYVFLDKLFDFDPENPGKGRIDVAGVEIFEQLRDKRSPFIVFTAHTANFELLSVAGNAYGLDLTVLFRPPNNPYVAQKIHDLRAPRMGALVPSHAGSSFALARQLERGGGVGILVDQKFTKGENTEFFGLPLKTNPLLAKLVRQFDCPVYPARCVRLPSGRFRLELEPALEIPRNEKGDVDVRATAQLLNDTVERWVREYPGQWLWYHDRWFVKSSQEFRDYNP
jgi:Kdo2-lipid IVA lauroyltransferase/acyltransferase